MHAPFTWCPMMQLHPISNSQRGHHRAKKQLTSLLMDSLRWRLCPTVWVAFRLMMTAETFKYRKHFIFFQRLHDGVRHETWLAAAAAAAADGCSRLRSWSSADSFNDYHTFHAGSSRCENGTMKNLGFKMKDMQWDYIAATIGYLATERQDLGSALYTPASH